MAPELRSGKNYDRWGPRNGLSQFLGAEELSSAAFRPTLTTGDTNSSDATEAYCLVRSDSAHFIGRILLLRQSVDYDLSFYGVSTSSRIPIMCRLGRKTRLTRFNPCPRFFVITDKLLWTVHLTQ